MLQDKLNKIVNKEFIYNQKRHRIRSWSIDEGDVRIFTDSGMIVISKEKIDEELELLKPVEASTPALTNNNRLSSMQGETIVSIKDTLMETIENIKKDPKYIPQANAINKTVNALVGVAKTEIALRESLR